MILAMQKIARNQEVSKTFAEQPKENPSLCILFTESPYKCSVKAF